MKSTIKKIRNILTVDAVLNRKGGVMDKDKKHYSAKKRRADSKKSIEEDKINQ